MVIDLSFEVQIIITSLQLIFYVFLAVVATYKMILSKKNEAKFLAVFYLFALLAIIVYIVMTIYQIVRIAQQQQIHMIILVIINIYSMILEAVLLFLLSFYWKQTEAMLRGSGLDSQQSVSNIKNQMKFKGVCLVIWFLIYTAYLIYGLVTNQYLNNQITQNIFYFAGQGVSALILIWSNVSQIISAKYFSITLNKYQALVSYSMNKTKFRCIYWIASSFNFLRLVYLIIITILQRIYDQNQNVQWLALFIYTATFLIPLGIYLYSFQISIKNKNQSLQSFSQSSDKSVRQIQTLYQPPQINSPERNKKFKRPRQSFNQTQLSSSYDSHGI